MKKFIQRLSLISFILSGAVACGGTSTPAQAVDEQKLLQKVSFDHDCPEDQIHIEKREKVGETEGFILEVCGKQAKYEGRDGTFHQLEEPAVAPEVAEPVPEEDAPEAAPAEESEAESPEAAE